MRMRKKKDEEKRKKSLIDQSTFLFSLVTSYPHFLDHSFAEKRCNHSEAAFWFQGAGNMRERMIKGREK